MRLILSGERVLMDSFEEEENDGGASFRRYRTIDLVIWIIIAAAMEAVATLAASKWFPHEIYCLSTTIAVTSIVMMRWNGFAAIQAVVGGFVYTIILAGFDVKEIVTYCVGNCFMLLGLLLFKFVGKEKIRGTWRLTAIYAVVMYCLAQIGRWVLTMIFGGSVGAIIGFFASDPITLLFTFVVVLISRVPDGLFEDQKHYIIRTDSERRKADGENYL